jgi:hypothetical protein
VSVTSPFIEGQIRVRVDWVSMAVLAIQLIASLRESTEPLIIRVILGGMGFKMQFNTLFPGQIFPASTNVVPGSPGSEHYWLVGYKAA